MRPLISKKETKGKSLGTVETQHKMNPSYNQAWMGGPSHAHMSSNDNQMASFSQVALHANPQFGHQTFGTGSLPPVSSLMNPQNLSMGPHSQNQLKTSTPFKPLALTKTKVKNIFLYYFIIFIVILYNVINFERHQFVNAVIFLYTFLIINLMPFQTNASGK